MVKMNGDKAVLVQNQLITGSNVTLSEDYNLIAGESGFSEHYMYLVPLSY